MLISVLLAAASAAFGQSAYEIQVYPSATVAPGRTFVELHSNTATRGPVDAPGGAVQPDVGAYHETLEITRGWTDWFETGFYTFSSLRSGEGWQWAGNHVRPRVRAPASWGWPVGVSLSSEIGFFRPRFQETRWDGEVRPIVDWSRGPLYISVNPALEKGVSFYGEGSQAWAFAPAAKLQWTVKKLGLGFEYYGNIGPVSNPLPASRAQHQLGPAFDLASSGDWELNFAPLWGLTRATDSLVVKLIVGRRF